MEKSFRCCVCRDLFDLEEVIKVWISPECIDEEIIVTYQCDECFNERRKYEK